MNPESTPQRARFLSDAGMLAEPRVDEALSLRDAPVEWQHLWFELAQRPWTALAIVPGLPELSALPTARRLVEVGQAYSTSGVHLIDASSVDAVTARATIAEIERCAREGRQCLVAVPSPLTRPAAIAVARAAGAALLLVPLGEARLRASRETIACIGRGHFLGAVATHPAP